MEEELLGENPYQPNISDLQASEIPGNQIETGFVAREVRLDITNDEEDQDNRNSS